MKNTFIAKPTKAVQSENPQTNGSDPFVNKEMSQTQAKLKLQQMKDFLRKSDISTLSIERFMEEAELTEEKFQDLYSKASSRETIVLKRTANECWVNSYNEKLLIAWNGKIDFQPVFDAYSCIMYIFTYISKSERAMSKLLEAARKEAQEENVPLKTQMKKLGSAYLTHREVSVQEAVYRALSMPLKRFTREVIFIPAHPNCTRITLPLAKLHKQQEEGTDDPFQPNLVDKYLERPTTPEFKDMCLADFSSKYKILSAKNNSTNKKELAAKHLLKYGLGAVQQRKNNAIIRFPKFSRSKKSEDYHPVLLKLYLPHYKEQIKPVEFDTYEEFYEEGSVKVNKKIDIIMKNMLKILKQQKKHILKQVNLKMLGQIWLPTQNQIEERKRMRQRKHSLWMRMKTS